MSLAPKIDEVRSTILDFKPNLGFITETWLRDTISGNHLHIPGYSFISRNRTTDIHGGIGLYIVDSIRYRSLDHLQDPEYEALWAWLRPKRLPHGIPCVVAATIFLVFTHVTSIMTTVAIRHVGAHPNVNKCPSM